MYSHTPPSHWTQLQEAAYSLVHGFRRGRRQGAEALAPLLGKSPGTLSNEVNPDVTTHKLGLDDAIAAELAADRYPILRAHASICHHALFCIPEPDEIVDDIELLERLTAWQSALGMSAAQIHLAFEDRRISMQEVDVIRDAFNRHIAKGQEFLARLEMLAEPER